jgi:hypothetical protein
MRRAARSIARRWWRSIFGMASRWRTETSLA